MDNNTKFSFPLYSPGKQCETTKNQNILAADLRLKESRLAHYTCVDGNVGSISEKTYQTKDYASFVDMAKDFIQQEGNFDRIAIGVPGPVINGKCETLNLPWALDEEEIKKALGASKVALINDLEATAYSLADFDQTLLEILHTSENKVRGNVAILAPGNGLGEAGLFWDGVSLRPFATEGGHSEFSPRNDFEIQFYQFLNKIYGIVTWENVLSKDGIYNVFRFLRDVGRHEESAELKADLQAGEFLPTLAKHAAQGNSRLANLTLEMYSEFLAREANNLVLKLKATGALIITGDITDTLFDLFNKQKFYKDFLISDRMQHLLQDIPLYVLRNKNSILEGAAYYGAFFED